VELQDFATRELYSRLGFNQPVLSILDRQGETMQLMHEALDLTNFTVPPTAVEVADEQNRDQFRIGRHQIFSRLTTADDLEDAVNRIEAFFNVALGHLDPPHIDSINVRSCDIAPAESFEGLRDRMNESLINDFSGLKNAMSIASSDAGWVQEFDEGDISGRVQFGPMRSEELADLLQVPERTDDPPNMLFLLVNTNVITPNLSTADAVERWQSATERQRGIANRVGGWLKDRLA